VTVTVYASGVTVEVIPRTVTPPPPPPAGLTWTKLATATGLNFGAYFRRPVMLGNGDVWMAWGANSQPDSGSLIFSRATKTFAKTSANSGVGWDIGKRENYGACFDPDRNAVWVGAGAPVAYSQPGDLKLDLATGAYTEVFPAAFNGSGDTAFLYHEGFHYSFGGWGNAACRRRDVTTGAITAYGGATQPQFTRQTQYGSASQESPRLTYARSGKRPDGTLWALANDNELWTCPLNGQWAMVATTGDKPTTIGIVATLVESRNCIVAWCGKSGMVVADAGGTVQQTWILDLASKAWTLATTATTPPATVMSQANLLSDGNSVFAVIDISGAYAEAWELTWGSL